MVNYESIFYVFLSSLITFEEIGVPVVVYLIFKYIEEERMKHKISSMYFQATCFMIAILGISSAEIVALVLYLFGWLQVPSDLFALIITSVFFIPVVGIPLSLSYLWVKEWRRCTKSS